MFIMLQSFPVQPVIQIMKESYISDKAGIVLNKVFHSVYKDKCLILSMAKKKKHFTKEIASVAKEKKTAQTNTENQTESTQSYEFMKDALMPELEELVKKNPNSLIGCGG